MSLLATLSDVGYRQLAQIQGWGNGDSAHSMAAKMAEVADYDVAGTWVRRRARKKSGRLIESIELVEVIGNETDLAKASLSWIESYFDSIFAKMGVRIRTTTEDLLGLIQHAAEQKQVWRAIRLAADALTVAGRQRLRSIFRDHIAPWFFQLYPAGKIVVIRYHVENENAAAITRCQYAATQCKIAEFGNEGFAGVRSLQSWHLNSITAIGPLLIELFNFLFYPFVGGFRGGPPGLDFLFLFDPSEQYAPPPFPRDWLAIPSSLAAFGKQRNDIIEVIRQFGSQGDVWQDEGHQRFRHDRTYPAEQRLDLLRWYVGQSNRLLYELADVANFPEGQSPTCPIDAVFAFEHYLTVDRLMRTTALAMSAVEPGMASHIVFEVADLYESLSERFKNHVNPTDFFKRLFDTREGPLLLRGRLALLPEPFSADLMALVERLYKAIEDKVIASIWIKSKVEPGGVKVRDKELKNEKVLPPGDFVGELMRVYRNAHHGYFTAGDPRQQRPSRYLFLVDGNLPLEMTALPALWWLAYLADSTLVGWKHLPLAAYD
ncbi:hypothetical protein AYO44_17945 [Planctomycetaceae bacterium SCGC AG-212-F19]|nr:hypothetical protein AYO44_17945 [Planctomycetaceae bacterium SCGC AG-212-F19]